MLYSKLQYIAFQAVELRKLIADHPDCAFLCYLLEMVVEQSKHQMLDCDEEEAAA